MPEKTVLATIAATMSAATLFLLVMFIVVGLDAKPDPESQHATPPRTLYLTDTTTVTAPHPTTVTVTATVTAAPDTTDFDYDAPNVDTPNIDGPDSMRELVKPWRW